MSFWLESHELISNLYKGLYGFWPPGYTTISGFNLPYMQEKLHIHTRPWEGCDLESILIGNLVLMGRKRQSFSLLSRDIFGLKSASFIFASGLSSVSARPTTPWSESFPLFTRVPSSRVLKSFSRDDNIAYGYSERPFWNRRRLAPRPFEQKYGEAMIHFSNTHNQSTCPSRNSNSFYMV